MMAEAVEQDTGRPRRDNPVDYRALAGMDKKAGARSAKSNTGSVKSGKSARSTKTATNKTQHLATEAQELEGRLEDVEKQLDKDGVYKAILYEQKQRELGDVFITEEQAPDVDELRDPDKFEQIKQIHMKEMEMMKDREVALKWRQELLELKTSLTDQRMRVEHMVWKQQMFERELEVETAEELLEMQEKEKIIEKRREKVRKRGEMLRRSEEEEVLPPEVTEAGELQAWMSTKTQGRMAKSDTGEVRGGRKERGRQTSKQADVQEGRLQQQMQRMGHTTTDSQRRIQELEEKLRIANWKLQRNSTGIDGKEEEGGLITGIPRLKQLGMIAGDYNEDAHNWQDKPLTKEELKKLGATQDYTGKDSVIDMHGMESGTVKSGKYVKSHIKLKKQEQWPHLNVMRKYVKRTSFEQLDFETFVAGESRTILLMGNDKEARARLGLLCKVAHWLCRSRDWVQIRGLYEAILESIELGEEDWFSDFSHYEMMVTCYKGEKITEKKRPEKLEIYWCKPYQKGNCNEKSPHMMSLRPDEPPVPVIHCCAICLQKDGKRMEHPEGDCPAKK